MKRLLLIFVSLLCMHASVESTIVVQGNSTSAPYGFKTDITANAYDKSTGTFFVGLEGDGSTTNPYTISKAARPSFNTAPQFTPVLLTTSIPPSGLLTSTIEMLALSPQTNIPAVLACVELNTAPQQATTIHGLFTNGTYETTSAALNDANGISVTQGIVSITANSTLIFAAVRPAGSAVFGDVGTGIAMIGVGATSNSLTLLTKDCTTGVDGNVAAALNAGSVVLKGSGPDDVLFTTTDAALCWNDTLQRLYIGLGIENNVNVGDIAKAVTVGQLSGGALIFNPIAPDSAITGVGTDEIVVTSNPSSSMYVPFIQVLHASTGPDYLIVNCANTVTGSDPYNRIFALPLVNDINNPNDATNGTIADKNSSLNSTTHKFTTPATNPGDLPINDPDTDPAAVVGAGDLPILGTDSISGMVVLGDTVYVSISQPPTTQNDAGIFYSQALFDNTGKIIRWTPWAKRGVPLNAFPGITLPGGATHNGSIQSFAVDGTTGNFWIVDGMTLQVVGISSWTTGVGASDLINTLSKNLSQGCFCSLDLDQATRGLLGSTTYRYALFGGSNKVAFAVTSIATQIANPSSPQTKITDYSLPQNFLLTQLPSGAGCCQTLEYSRTSTTNGDTNNLNYFFAGTQNGLYVFTDSSGNGFNIYGAGALNASPFSSRSWQKVSTISGSVIDLKTSGADHTLYVLTLNTSATAPLSSTLYSIPFQTTLSAMFATGNIRTIAQTGVGVFQNIIQFTGIQIIATDQPDTANPETKEQLVLATNQGLFTSNADQMALNGIEDATSQTDANWQLVASGDSTTAKTAFTGIAGVDTPVRDTVWPISVQDQYGYKTFDRSSIHQFSGVGDSSGTAPLFNSFFTPLTFNANPQTAAFTTLDPIIYFFSDGGRRFFVYNRVQDVATQVRLGVIPYDVSVWLVAQPNMLSTPVLDIINRFYWVKQIGATGILLAGTGTGVVGLQ